MSIKVSQREYFTEHLPEALPLAVLEDINESFALKYKLPKAEKKMRKAMRFAKTVYVKSMATKFAKTANILTFEKLEVDEVEMLKPLSTQLEYLFLMEGFNLEMVENVTCIHVLSNWTACLKLPLSSSIPFMKGALNEKIKALMQAAESAALLDFSNKKMQKEDQERVYREIREKEKAMKEADELAERQRAAKRRQAAVEMMDLDLIIIKRVQKVSIIVPYVEGKANLGRIFLTSWQHQHLLDEARGGVYGLPERPELEICEFEFKVFLPFPAEEERMITLTFLFDRIKMMFIFTKKLEDRLLLYVLQGGRGNLWQHDITPLKSAICRVGEEEFSTVDVFLQKNWRRLLIRHIAPLRTDPERVAYVRDLRERIVHDGDVAMEADNLTPEGSASDDSSSSEDTAARRKRKKREKRLKKKKEEERKARKVAKEKKKKQKKEEDGEKEDSGELKEEPGGEKKKNKKNKKKNKSDSEERKEDEVEVVLEQEEEEGVSKDPSGYGYGYGGGYGHGDINDDSSLNSLDSQDTLETGGGSGPSLPGAVAVADGDGADRVDSTPP